MNLARVRKTIVVALGMVVTLVLLIPEESVPDRWRPAIGIVLALGTIAGVYQVRNAPAVRSRAELIDHLPPPTRAATEEERPRLRRKPPPYDVP